MFPDLPQRLVAALLDPSSRPLSRQLGSQSGPLPTRTTTLLAPSLAYGRHRGPAPASVRRAAVAVVWLQRDDGSWWLPLTLRPLNLRHHAGQICFPGGMIEPGESPAQAALREFQEELGHALIDPLMCGELDPLYIFASHNLVYPVVFTATAPAVSWNPDPVEVECVLELPLAMLLSQESPQSELRTRQIIRDQQCVGSYQFRSLAYRFEEHRIWGATAMLLGQLAQIIRCAGCEEFLESEPPRQPETHCGNKGHDQEREH